MVIPIFQYFKYKNVGGMLILPILVSICFDIYGSYLMVSGSWTIIIGFLYPIVALLVNFSAFGLLIQTKSLFRVAFAITAIALFTCIAWVFVIHGIERTNLIRTTFIHALAIPATLGVSVMYELDKVVSLKDHSNQLVTLLNRTWIVYFTGSYMNWNISYFTIQFEDELMRMYFNLGLDFLHVVGYCALIVSYLYVINKTNLKTLWKIPQTS